LSLGRYLSSISTYTGPRAAANFLARHGGKFRHELLEDHRAVYTSLKGLVENKNADLKRDGFCAMDTFLREVKRVVVVIVSLSCNFRSSDPDSGSLVCSISLASLSVADSVRSGFNHEENAEVFPRRFHEDLAKPFVSTGMWDGFAWSWTPCGSTPRT
jgi:hypothetical protein